MLKLHAFLNRKPSSLLPPPCQVEAVVELDAVSFENLLQRPMDDQPQISSMILSLQSLLIILI